MRERDGGDVRQKPSAGSHTSSLSTRLLFSFSPPTPLPTKQPTMATEAELVAPTTTTAEHDAAEATAALDAAAAATLPNAAAVAAAAEGAEDDVDPIEKLQELGVNAGACGGVCVRARDVKRGCRGRPRGRGARRRAFEERKKRSHLFCATRALCATARAHALFHLTHRPGRLCQGMSWPCGRVRGRRARWKAWRRPAVA
jgi:hypothetical protein